MRAKLALCPSIRSVPCPVVSVHCTHVAFPLSIWKSRRDVVILSFHPTAKTNPLFVLPLPYTTVSCDSPEGTGTVRVCAWDPVARGDSMIGMVRPSSVFCEERGTSSCGTVTKAFSFGAYQRERPGLRSVSYTHLRAHETRH